MHIVCPNCTTSFAINPAALGATGRTVRCSRCKLTWLARAEDALEAVAPAMTAGPAAARRNVAAEWDAMAQEDSDTPVVESPSVSPDWPAHAAQHEAEADWTTAARHDIHDEEAEPPKRSRLRELFALPPFPPIPMLRGAGLTATCAAMAAVVLAMIVWRGEVVRLMPQTAAFYRLVGLEVNLRGLAFKDI